MTHAASVYVGSKPGLAWYSRLAPSTVHSVASGKRRRSTSGSAVTIASINCHDAAGG